MKKSIAILWVFAAINAAEKTQEFSFKVEGNNCSIIQANIALYNKPADLMFVINKSKDIKMKDWNIGQIDPDKSGKAFSIHCPVYSVMVPHIKFIPKVSTDEGCFSLNMYQRFLSVDEPKDTVETFWHTKAVEQAHEDTKPCYKNVLQKALALLGNKKEKSIAIELLGTSDADLHHERICAMFSAITQSMKHNSEAFKDICIILPEEFELTESMTLEQLFQSSKS